MRYMLAIFTALVGSINNKRKIFTESDTCDIKRIISVNERRSRNGHIYAPKHAFRNASDESMIALSQTFPRMPPSIGI